jgi:hypothetical protein
MNRGPFWLTALLALVMLIAFGVVGNFDREDGLAVKEAKK